MKIVGHTDNERHLDHPEYSELRHEIQTHVNAICEIVSQAWERHSDQYPGLPNLLEVQYEGQNSQGDIRAFLARYADGDWRDCLTVTAEPWAGLGRALLADPEHHAIRLVLGLTALSGHSRWQRGYGSFGFFKIAPESRTIAEYRHITFVLQSKHDEVDVKKLLGYEGS